MAGATLYAVSLSFMAVLMSAVTHGLQRCVITSFLSRVNLFRELVTEVLKELTMSLASVIVEKSLKSFTKCVL